MGDVGELAVGLLDHAKGMLHPALDDFLMDRAPDVADERIVQASVRHGNA